MRQPQVKRPAVWPAAVNGTCGFLRPSDEAWAAGPSYSPGPSPAPRGAAQSPARVPGRRPALAGRGPKKTRGARAGLAAGLPSGPGASALGPTPGFRAEHAGIALPAPLRPPAAPASRAASAPLTAFFMVAAMLGLDYGARRGGPRPRAPPPGLPHAPLARSARRIQRRAHLPSCGVSHRGFLTFRTQGANVTWKDLVHAN